MLLLTMLSIFSSVRNWTNLLGSPFVQFLVSWIYVGFGVGGIPKPQNMESKLQKKAATNGIQLPPRSLNIAPQKLPGPNRKVVCQPPFSGELLNFRGVYFCRCFFVDRFCTFVLVFFFSVRGEAPIRAPSIYYLIAWLFQASDGDIRSSPHIYIYMYTYAHVNMYINYSSVRGYVAWRRLKAWDSSWESCHVCLFFSATTRQASWFLLIAVEKQMGKEKTASRIRQSILEVQ